MNTPHVRIIVFDRGDRGGCEEIVYRTLQTGGYSFSLKEVWVLAGGKEKFQAIKDLISISETSGVHAA